jgi:hypothetical protein
MKLSEIVKCGDWLLYYPKKIDFLDKLIMKATFSKLNHAAMVKDSQTVFETDGDMFKAGYTPLADVEGRHVLVIRCKSLQGKEQKILELMEKYKGSPYGYSDLIKQGLLFWMATPIRKKVVSFFGLKPIMDCSELMTRISYEAGGRKELRDYGGFTPEDDRKVMLEYPDEYELVKDYNPEAE